MSFGTALELSESKLVPVSMVGDFSLFIWSIIEFK